MTLCGCYQWNMSMTRQLKTSTWNLYHKSNTRLKQRFLRWSSRFRENKSSKSKFFASRKISGCLKILLANDVCSRKCVIGSKRCPNQQIYTSARNYIFRRGRKLRVWFPSKQFPLMRLCNLVFSWPENKFWTRLNRSQRWSVFCTDSIALLVKSEARRFKAFTQL